MPSVHVIRLRGPWRYAPARSAGESDLSARAGKVILPATRAALPNELSGAVYFLRAFNRPTNLADQRVSLVVQPTAPLVAAWLNERPLALTSLESDPTATRRCQLEDLLPTSNQLRLEMALPAETAEAQPLVGEVWLEIAEG